MRDSGAAGQLGLVDQAVEQVPDVECYRSIVRGSIERVLAALEQAGVDYVVVGGVAVVLHGHLRTTADLDIVVRLSGDHARRAVEALTRLGMRPRLPVSAQDFADPTKRREWIATKGLTVFSFWDPNDAAFVIDVFAEEPFDFSAVHARARRVPLSGATAVVVAIEDLVAMKRASGRPIDLDDVVHLEQLLTVSDDQGED